MRAPGHKSNEFRRSIRLPGNAGPGPLTNHVPADMDLAVGFEITCVDLIEPCNRKERIMGMFETTGKSQTEDRSENTLKKLERMNKALRHEEPDRVPISDFFWGSFMARWRQALGLPDDANPYYHYDMDWIATVPNMDPWIRSYETLSEDDEEVVVKTGFGAFMRKKFDLPMPEMYDWETNTFEKLGKKGGVCYVRHAPGGSPFFARTYAPVTELATYAPDIKTLDMQAPGFEADGAVALKAAVDWFNGVEVEPVRYLPKHIISAKDVEEFMPAQW